MGLRTKDGKARAARNALKHGARSARAIAFTQEIREALLVMKQV